MSKQQYNNEVLLINSVKQNNITQAKALIEKGVDINCFNDNEVSLLSYAASKGYSEMVKLLVEYGASINVLTPKTKNTLLHIASKKNDHDLAQYLIDKQIININALNSKGNAAIHIASKYGTDEIIEVLLNEGASINIKNNYKKTPLYIAKRKNGQVVEKIIKFYTQKLFNMFSDNENSINIKKYIKENYKAINFSYLEINNSSFRNVAEQKNYDSKLIRIIQKYLGKSNIDEYEQSSLVIDEEEENFSNKSNSANSLITDDKNTQQSNAMEQLSQKINKDQEMIDSIFARIAALPGSNENSNVPEEDMTSSLGRALIEICIERGRENGSQVSHEVKRWVFHVINSMIKTLEQDMYNGDFDFNKALNWQNEDGNSVLHIAASKNYCSVVLALINLGADLTLKNNDDLTIFDIAKNNNYKFLAKKLKEYCLKINILIPEAETTNVNSDTISNDSSEDNNLLFDAEGEEELMQYIVTTPDRDFAPSNIPSMEIIEKGSLQFEEAKNKLKDIFSELHKIIDEELKDHNVIGSSSYFKDNFNQFCDKYYNKYSGTKWLEIINNRDINGDTFLHKVLVKQFISISNPMLSSPCYVVIDKLINNYKASLNIPNNQGKTATDIGNELKIRENLIKELNFHITAVNNINHVPGVAADQIRSGSKRKLIDLTNEESTHQDKREKLDKNSTELMNLDVSDLNASEGLPIGSVSNLNFYDFDQ